MTDPYDLSQCLARSDECTEPAPGRRLVRGLCTKHYARWKNGEPLPVAPKLQGSKEPLPDAAKFAYYTDIRSEGECWLWCVSGHYWRHVGTASATRWWLVAERTVCESCAQHVRDTFALAATLGITGVDLLMAVCDD